MSILRYDTKLLKRLERETCVYDLVKEGFPRSSAYNILKEFARQGIVNVKTEKIKSGFGIKRKYILNELGLSLLEILEKINENRLNPPKKKKYYFINSEISKERKF